MTERQAEKIANLVIGAAVLGAAVYVLRTPALRRVVWGAARNALVAGLPAWLLAETRQRLGRGCRQPANRPRYDRRVSPPSAPATSRPGPATPSRADDDHTPRPPRAASKLRRTFLRIRNEIRLTGLAIWRGVVGVYNSDDLTFAASIAYYSLLSLFPFFLLLLSLIAGVTSSDADRQAVLDFVLRYFPRQFPFVTSQLAAMQAARVQLGVAGSILMIWAAMGVFGAITSAVNHAWGVEKQPSYFKHKMISFTMLVMASLLLVAALALVSTINVVEARWFAAVVERHETAAQVPELRGRLGEHLCVHLRRRPGLLLRAQCEGAVS